MVDGRVREWVDPPAVHVPPALRRAVGGHPLVAETLARRGYTQVGAALAFLDPDRYEPALPTDLPGMVRAVDRLERAIRQGETVCVWGDFDVDGQTATTLLVSTLKDLAARWGSSHEAAIRFHIPNRARESHGVNLSVLKRFIEEGVALILTCDTGVTANEPIAYAQAQGVDVIVTDHHDLPSVLPSAHAVINPKMLPATHPLRQLPGVGCAYKLAEALYARAGRPHDAAQYLDLVALGIVADVAVQTGDTRYLLQRGLEVLRHTPRLGLQVMMETAEVSPDRLTEEHIAFMLAPRLNALGRLADAEVAVEFLTTDDLSRARIQAVELEGLNARRKLLCDQVTQAAEAQIERDPSLLEQGALVLSHPSWPAGVIGIVAGRLAERYHRPTVLIAAPPGELARGSGRSIEGCNIAAAIAAHGDLLEGFGGHPMAAGLSMHPDRIPEFRVALGRTVLEMLGETKDGSPLQIDGVLQLAELSLDLVEELERLAPFGPGNPPLVLSTNGLTLVGHSAVGRTGEHLRLTVRDEDGTEQGVIWWQGAKSSLPGGRFDLAYVVRASDYRGERAVQVEWVYGSPEKESRAALRPEPPALQIHDRRGVPGPQKQLDLLRAQGDVEIWGEAVTDGKIVGRDRYSLQPSEALAIWTTPPGPAELREALGTVSPGTVFLFGIDPEMDAPQVFLRRLAGLAKRALRVDQGRVTVSALAAATAQRESTVRAGLAWLAARGHVAVLHEDGDEVRLVAGSQVASPELSRVAAQLKAFLEETAAYRAHFARADAQSLVQG